MRQAGVIPEERQAALFAAHLTAQGIDNRLDRGAAGEREIWIRDDDQLDLAKAELAAFLANPQDAKYQGAEQAAKQIVRERKKRWAAARRNFVDMSRHWDKPAASTAPVTFALVAVSVAAFIALQLGQYQDRALNLLAIVPGFDEGRPIWGNGQVPSLNPWEPWRLITPIFLHFSIVHIFCNMSWLMLFGPQIETRRGSWRFAGLALTIAIVSNSLEYAVSPWPHFGGMSGVVAGLFGYVWMKGRYDRTSGLYVDRVTVNVMLIWLAICLTGCVGNIANMAHFSGLATGMAIGYFPPNVAKLLRRPSNLK